MGVWQIPQNSTHTHPLCGIFVIDRMLHPLFAHLKSTKGSSMSVMVMAPKPGMSGISGFSSARIWVLRGEVFLGVWVGNGLWDGIFWGVWVGIWCVCGVLTD